MLRGEKQEQKEGPRLFIGCRLPPRREFVDVNGTFEAPDPEGWSGAVSMAINY